MLRFVFAFLLIAIVAKAESPYQPLNSPIITQINHTGYMLPEYRRFETCAVYLDRVVVTTEFGQGPNRPPVIMRRVLQANFSPNIHQMIATASREEYRVSNIQICDAPTTVIEAQAPYVKKFRLFTSGSCGEPRAEREGANSFHLRKIVDSFCPETNDPGGDTEERN